MSFEQQQQHSTMSSHPLVWFQLVDSATGEPYTGTSVSSLVRSSLVVPVVDQFREAVKAEYPNRLSSVDSGALIVYKNKSAFDNRNLADNEGKEEQLYPGYSLASFGASWADPMIVVVPATQLSSFTLYQGGFFNEISSATESHGFISFRNFIPNTSLNTLYIRDSYRKIASSIKSGINKVIITGTPGIGKSLFLIYLLWKLVREGKRVLFVYHPFNIYYDGKGGVYGFESGNLPSVYDLSFWNDTLWCLFDCKLKKESSLERFPFELCTFILSTSPRREMINDFKKPPAPQYFFMPTWEKAELKAIAPVFDKSDEWEERFVILGGIPRFVLESTELPAISILEAACSEFSLDDCIRKIGMNSEITDKSKVIHSLVHVKSVSPFTQSSVCFASETALNVIYREKYLKNNHKMRELLSSCEGNPLTQALCGYIFERYAIELLEKGGTFACRELVSGKKKSNAPAEGSLEVPRSTKEIEDTILPTQLPNQLYVPKTKNYVAIDAWIHGIGAFQMTVGKTHDIKPAAKKHLAQLGKANRLYWLLPPLYYHSFTKKSPFRIEQYAVLIPLPE